MLHLGTNTNFLIKYILLLQTSTNEKKSKYCFLVGAFNQICMSERAVIIFCSTMYIERLPKTFSVFKSGLESHTLQLLVHRNCVLFELHSCLHRSIIIKPTPLFSRGVPKPKSNLNICRAATDPLHQVWVNGSKCSTRPRPSQRPSPRYVGGGALYPQPPGS